MIDIGANLTKPAFSDDLEAVLQRARRAGVEHIIVTGTDLAASQAALALARSHGGLLSATAGVHPHQASDWNTDRERELRTLLAEPETRAAGETGLDYFRDRSPRPQQRRCFEAQLALAAECGKPIFLHHREAAADFLAIMREWRDRLGPAVVHCFTDSRDMLRGCLELDLHIGITGWICDERRGLPLRELVREIPLERLMIETDAPYLLPRDLDPPPTSRRNEPCHLPHIARRIAECRGEALDEFLDGVTATSRRFFGLNS